MGTPAAALLGFFHRGITAEEALQTFWIFFAQLNSQNV